MSRNPTKPVKSGSELGVQRIRVDAQGYDKGGGYWGAGPDVFIGTTADGTEEITVRARNVKEARATAVAELAAPLARDVSERDRIGGHPVRKSRFEIDWRNAVTGETVRLSVTHSRDYLSPGQDHVEIESIAPARVPLPLTETGYRSHFIPGADLARFGSVRRFVEGWLETAAKAKDWLRKQQAAAQGDLFQWAEARHEVGAKGKRRTATRPAAVKRPARRRDRTPGS